jgi:hypothetical protein
VLQPFLEPLTACSITSPNSTYSRNVALILFLAIKPKEEYRIELLGVTLARFSRPFAPMSAFFQTEGVEVESTEVLPSTL